MSYSRFDWYSWLIVSTFLLFIVFFLVNCGFIPCLSLREEGLLWGSYFCFDSISIYLSLLSGLLGISLVYFASSLSILSRVMIFLSLFSSFLSYVTINIFWFWVFYEISILSLLLLLVSESPYSERYIASWYLLGYVLLTSLPMLLCLSCLSLFFGSFLVNSWSWADGVGFGSSVYIILGVLFITKIPLPPFHVWLPIVHAEASSVVSVCLSGYIMKLGILGLCRFCSWVLPFSIFTNFYIVLSLGLSSLFFLCSCRELDGKRWLAFLSLSHIVIACVCVSVGSYGLSGLSFLYCLGHGLSAGVIFLFLWLSYDLSGSRNWGLLKFSLSTSLFIRCLCVGCLCTACSLPPTLQFFCEVGVLMDSGFISWFYVFVLSVYLFFGGLVPLFLVGCLLTRHYSVSVSGFSVFCGFSSIFFVLVWSFFLFLVC